MDRQPLFQQSGATAASDTPQSIQRVQAKGSVDVERGGARAAQPASTPYKCMCILMTALWALTAVGLGLAVYLILHRPQAEADGRLAAYGPHAEALFKLGGDISSLQVDFEELGFPPGKVESLMSRLDGMTTELKEDLLDLPTAAALKAKEAHQAALQYARQNGLGEAATGLKEGLSDASAAAAARVKQVHEAAMEFAGSADLGRMKDGLSDASAAAAKQAMQAREAAMEYASSADVAQLKEGLFDASAAAAARAEQAREAAMEYAGSADVARIKEGLSDASAAAAARAEQAREAAMEYADQAKQIILP